MKLEPEIISEESKPNMVEISRYYVLIKDGRYLRLYSDGIHWGAIALATRFNGSPLDLAEKYDAQIALIQEFRTDIT